MSEYVSRVLLEVNGQSIEDFKQVEEDEVELAKEVNLMNTTGVVGVTPRRRVSVDYVIPKDKAEFDFGSVKDGTLTIDLDNGTRIQYTGVTTLKIGATTYDGEKEAGRKITFSATERLGG